MIFSNNAQLNFILQKYPFQILLLLVIILLTVFLIIITKYKNTSRDYKIYNFKVNAFILSTYFFIFIIGVIYIRFSRWGYTINLLDLFSKTYLLFETLNTIHFIILILLLCITFNILVQLKQLFIREVIKRHLYLYFNKKYKNLLFHIEQQKNLLSDIIMYHPYVRIIQNLASCWSYESIINNYIYNNFILPYSIITQKENYPLWMDKPLTKILLSLQKIILILIFSYECFYNNWTLHLIFYYLPFYIIISLYKNITDFLSKTNEEINRIIYERYYEEENVLYVNTTTEEDNFILNYITNGFRCFSHDTNKWEEKILLINFSKIFISNRRFYKIKGTFIYENDKGEQIDSKENIIVETYK